MSKYNVTRNDVHRVTLGETNTFKDTVEYLQYDYKLI